VSKDKRHPILEWALKMYTNSISEKKKEEEEEKKEKEELEKLRKKKKIN
jgi:hypothetical protein